MPQLISSKNLLLSTRPLTVGIASSPEAVSELLSLSAADRADTCDLIELRLDLLNVETSELRQVIPMLELPILLTARHPDEGGKGSADAAGRIAMIEPLLDLAAIVDVELRSVPDMRSLIKKAQGMSVQVMGSFHDFTATPGDEILTGAIEMANTAALNAVKLATYLNSPDDLIRLMRFVSGHRRLPMSVMGMGNLGRMSRLTLAKLGSVLNYGYVGQSNAPGQWPAERLKELLAEM